MLGIRMANMLSYDISTIMCENKLELHPKNWTKGYIGEKLPSALPRLTTAALVTACQCKSDHASWTAAEEPRFTLTRDLPFHNSVPPYRRKLWHPSKAFSTATARVLNCNLIKAGTNQTGLPQGMNVLNVTRALTLHLHIPQEGQLGPVQLVSAKVLFHIFMSQAQTSAHVANYTHITMTKVL